MTADQISIAVMAFICLAIIVCMWLGSWLKKIGEEYNSVCSASPSSNPQERRTGGRHEAHRLPPAFFRTLAALRGNSKAREHSKHNRSDLFRELQLPAVRLRKGEDQSSVARLHDDEHGTGRFTLGENSFAAGGKRV